MSGFSGLTGRVSTIREARDELDAIQSLVAVIGAVVSSDLGRDVWGDGVAYLARFCCEQMDRVDTVLGGPEGERS